MNFAVNYYRLILPITLEVETRRNYLASELAQRFIDECIPAELLEACPKTKYIKRWHETLWLQAQDKDESLSQRAIATTALRCYVSWRLEATAKVIVNRYQSLKPEDINLDTVRNSLLEDINLKHQYILKKSDNSKHRKLVKISQNEPASVKSQKQAQAYQPLSFEILETWNPKLESASSLDSWVRRKALSAKIMKPLGIDRHTSWYRLCKVSQRYRKLFYDHEQQHIKIFQQIYDSELHKHRSNLRDSYPNPTADQWSRMRDLLAVALNRSDLEVSQVENCLSELANDIRRLYFDIPPRRALLTAAVEPKVDHNIELAVTEAIGELGGVKTIIQKAVQEVFLLHEQNISAKLQKQNINFQELICLYYCQGLNQTEIAHQIGGRHQSSCSRLFDPKGCLSRTNVQCIDMVVALALKDFYVSDDPDSIMELRACIEEFFYEELESARKLLSSRKTAEKCRKNTYFQFVCSLYS
ncbi:hypothetical protein [[Limnothrix rosea] IAM M-220]|uniref:hypothetical protein n=1 Tax=[Limnothrix rosea] IAM M-220 TaxID=454133 RepID=UPI000962370C|nr:hypothetical protein [[Limnothrix rosea] IAM M-220]OKH18882.1 hypothetical protein NIES208_03980 [[Limnothrix rosea] IAM M-220]